MQIEAGKYYRTRGGDVVGPMRQQDTCSIYPWATLKDQWTISGSFFTNSDGPLDLISEVYISDTPPDAPSDDLIVRMNFSELARKGCKTNSGNVHFFCGMDYIHAHYSIILHWEEGISPPVPPAPLADALVPEAKTLRDEFAGLALTGFAANPNNAAGTEESAQWAYRYADAMMEARKK